MLLIICFRTALMFRKQFIGITRRGKVVKPIIYNMQAGRNEAGQWPKRQSPSDLSMRYARMLRKKQTVKGYAGG
jgi:hypothetical protein